jgi:hypothetical protein
MPFIDLLFANVDKLCADEQTVRVLLFIETPRITRQCSKHVATAKQRPNAHF